MEVCESCVPAQLLQGNHFPFPPASCFLSLTFHQSFSFARLRDAYLLNSFVPGAWASLSGAKMAIHFASCLTRQLSPWEGVTGDITLSLALSRTHTHTINPLLTDLHKVYTVYSSWLSVTFRLFLLFIYFYYNCLHIYRQYLAQVQKFLFDINTPPLLYVPKPLGQISARRCVSI